MSPKFHQFNVSRPKKIAAQTEQRAGLQDPGEAAWANAEGWPKRWTSNENTIQRPTFLKEQVFELEP